MSDRPAGSQPEHNIYTVLVILATLITGGATVFLAIRSQTYFGTWYPF
jgi:hypothetical protein